MLKQIIALIVLSIAISLSMSHIQHGLQFLIDAHDWISHALMDVFSGGQAGNLLRDLITLLSIPIFIGLIPAIIYWLVKRHRFPYFMEIVWIVWLVQAGALVILYKIAA
ncbi:MAG: hypothetical protein JO149_07785 [Gammaproteobacteria bacterium]|nr:hypothetical protein [Gammaproteobacteria bacterium]